MIRFFWVVLIAAFATLLFGLLAIVAALLRVRGTFYGWCTRMWSRAILWASGTRVIVHGAESVDWNEPKVLVSNHISEYDIFALSSAVPGPFYFIGKKELDLIPFFGTAWKAAGHISIDRTNRQKALATLRRAGEKLRREHGTVIIFPEGTRSRTGELLPFKKGAFMLSLEAGVPVLPTVIQGSDRIKPAGRMRVRPHPIHVTFGPTIAPEAFADAGSDAFIAEVRARVLSMREASPRVPETGTT